LIAVVQRRVSSQSKMMSVGLCDLLAPTMGESESLLQLLRISYAESSCAKLRHAAKSSLLMQAAATGLEMP